MISYNTLVFIFLIILLNNNKKIYIIKRFKKKISIKSFLKKA